MLTRFISKSLQHALPFFKLKRKGTKLKWDEKCEATFQKVKEKLPPPPMLVRLEVGETLYLYLVVANKAISVALSPRNMWTPEVDLHHEYYTPRGWAHAPKSWIGGFCSNNNNKEAKTIFPIASDSGADQPTHLKNLVSTWLSWNDGCMDHWVFRAWHSFLALTSN